MASIDYSASIIKKKKSPSSYFSQSSSFSWWKGGSVWARVGYFFGFCAVIGFVILIVGYITLKSSLPSLDRINDKMDQATVIKDRNGEILYKIYEQNRSYVQFEDISPNMVNAIIAIEDNTFWTNSGIDIRGIIRSAKTAIFGGRATGASTITQQLLKNILLSKESSKYTRKLKEWLLAGELNDFVKEEVKKNHPQLKGDELYRKMKEEILELYLNYVFLGQNSYGVQAASQTYFAKNAKDLSPLEASILASLPKSPTKYNPYKDRRLVMGKLHFYKDEKEIKPSDVTYKKAVDHVATLLPRLQVVTDAKSLIKQLEGLMAFSLSADGATYRISYGPGRKDYVLAQMVEEGLLDQALFKKAFLDAFTYKFVQGKKTDIKAPHFVWWIRDVVLKMYPKQGVELLNRGGLQITTTLDYKTQKFAEAAIKENYRKTLGYGANNSSLVYMDSKNGDVLAYVGSVNYNDKKIDGEVDMVRALRQPGSSIKPFIYALGIQKLGLTADTPIFDLRLRIGRNTPHNSDGGFKGYMPLRKALAYSRNIAPIKIFLSLGGEQEVKTFLRHLGLKSLKPKVGYGYPLAIGAGEVTMLELANAYMYLSASGKPATIDPILEIRKPEGDILYKKEVVLQEQYMSEGVANLLSSILSNRSNMPPGWVSNYRLRGGITYATKSGTSDMKVRRGVIRPRDGWLAAYTPSKVAIFWSGNTDAKPMGSRAYGGWLNAPIWKAFWGQLIRNGTLTNEQFPKNGTKWLSIEKYSGLLPAGGLPKEAMISTRAFAGKMPSHRSPEWKSVKYDASCNGRVTALTPEEDVKEGWIITPTTFMPNKKDLSAITEWFTTQSGLFLKEPEDACEGRSAEKDDKISLNAPELIKNPKVEKIFSLAYSVKGPRPLKYMKVYLNDQEITEVSLGEKSSVNGTVSVSAYKGLEYGKHLLILEAVDAKGFMNRKEIPVTIVAPDKTAPTLVKNSLKVTPKAGGWAVSVSFTDDASGIKSATMKVSGIVLASTLKDGVVTFSVTSVDKPVTYKVLDGAGNVLDGTLTLPQQVKPKPKPEPKPKPTTNTGSSATGSTNP